VRFAPLSLGILAALSYGHDVRIVDGDWDAKRLDLLVRHPALLRVFAGGLFRRPRVARQND